MDVDSTLLLAYVDGHLSPSQCEDVERQMALSPDVATCVADLHASKLPYRQAFASQKLPPVPDSLTQKVAAMALAHEKTASATSAANDRALPAGQPAAPTAPIRSPLRAGSVRMGLAFVAGIATCAIGLTLTQDPVMTGAKLAASTASAPETTAAWVRAAAGYQQLYSRVTIDQVVVDAGTAARTAAAIRHEDGLAVRIPDLDAQGLAFKRVQRLRFHEQPLVQIVYLPTRGEPVALCVMKDDRADHGIVTGRVGGMEVATWHSGALAYALIGKPDGVDLDALARRISANEVTHLFDDA